jgi:microcin C transport system substrate-binding protein
MTKLILRGALICSLGIFSCTENHDKVEVPKQAEVKDPAKDPLKDPAKDPLKDPTAAGENSSQSADLYKIYTLPEGLVWETNNDDAIYSSPEAVTGGTFRSFLLTFPLTLRTVGPDANGSFRAVLDANQLNLTNFHPNSDKVIPELAIEWANDKDGVTLYYKLDPKAVWSDGKPVIADDFVFAYEMMRSKSIVDPWSNEHYTEEVLSVKKYDDRTISITGKVAKPKNDMHYYYGMSPRPRHFHKLDENWVKNFNWTIEPNTGPYAIAKVEKGKSITLERKKDWFARDYRYNKNRFNIDRVVYTVIRDVDVAWEHFKKGELEAFGLTLPDYWHEKSKIDIFTNGYAHKAWFYVDQPQTEMGMWLNQDEEIFKDLNVRLAFNYAMNFDKVIKSVLRNDYFRLQTGTTGYGKYTNSAIKARGFDLDKVRELMTKSGWARGKDGIWEKDNKRYSVRITFGAPHHEARLVVLKEEAKKAGIELELQLLDGSAAFKTTQEKKHQVAWTGWGAQYRPDYWSQYHSANAHKTQTNNISNTDNKELDKLIDAYRAELVEEKRYELAHKIQQMIFDDGAFIPSFLVPYFREAYWRWWKLPKVMATKMGGELFDPFGASGGLFWLDAKTRDETLAAMKAGKKFPPVTTIEETYKKL